jgi:hypothetical protein
MSNGLHHTGFPRPGVEAGAGALLIREMLWAPSAERVANSKMARYQRWLAQTHGVQTTDFTSLWRWSVDHRGPFWRSIWEYFDVLASQTSEVAATDDAMPGTRWFPGARLNWAQNLLRPTGHHNPAIISSEKMAPPNSCREPSWSHRSPTSPHIYDRLASDPATGSPPSYPTSPQPSLRCWPAPASGVRGNGRTAGGRTILSTCWTQFQILPRRRGRGRHSRYSPPHGFQE